MRLLLDTHALIWWFSGDSSLTPLAKRQISDPKNDVVVSAACGWEIATKYRLGRLPNMANLILDFALHLDRQGFVTLSITSEHAVRAGLLPGTHKDPFDRMLIAQAQAENLAIITDEKIFDDYGVRRIW